MGAGGGVGEGVGGKVTDIHIEDGVVELELDGDRVVLTLHCGDSASATFEQMWELLQEGELALHLVADGSIPQ